MRGKAKGATTIPIVRTRLGPPAHPIRSGANQAIPARNDTMPSRLPLRVGQTTAPAISNIRPAARPAAAAAGDAEA
jgi:hypothetical protein